MEARPIVDTVGQQASSTSDSSPVLHHDIVIVGGGTAGITVAARLTKGWGNRRDVAIIEPSDKHYYQPAWTLAGAGTFDKAKTERNEAAVIPARATWIQDAVAEFDPDHNRLRTASGQVIEYNQLVVAAGIRIRWDAVKGLSESVGHYGVCSNYSFETVDSTWDNIRNLSSGTAVFTQPAGAIKCGGAPQKICYLAEDYFRRHGVRKDIRVIFASAADSIFAVEPYKTTLENVVKRKGIATMFRHELIAVSADTNEAIFRNLDTGEEVSVHFDMLHVTPPMGPPAFIAESPLADESGWVDVDRNTLQHTRYANVFALGDCANLPTSKTGAAIRKQAPVAVKNLLSAAAAKPLTASYDGYTSCPIVTGYGKLVLAEFDYDKRPEETFPFDQSKERWSMWMLKKYVLPVLYWSGMLKGRA
ncbi:MAG: NAD(P)/FAD-dependent oxidoreductase [Planctomycetales bacterium]|nr:NAD(P)/FAD-dependent oxidoreductase [Planctomycetales bacterium]